MCAQEPPTLHDKEIVQGFLRGDKRDYDTIVGWMKEMVRNNVWVAAITHDDVVAETCLTLLTNLRAGKFRFESSLKTYVQRMTKYTVIRLVRAHRRAEKYITEKNMNPSNPETPEQIYEDKEEVFLFHRMLSLMDEKCRELWRMILYEELSYKEIAAKLNVSESAIKVRIHRCKEAAMQISERLK